MSTKLVIFIHGILEGPQQFNDFILNVPDSFSSINVLLPGHGGTVEEFANSNMFLWKQHLYTIIEEEQSHYDDIILVGHSMGTLLAVDCSLVYPDKIKGLFLLAMPTRIRLTLTGAINSLKVGANRINEFNPLECAAKRAYSLTPTLSYNYLRFIPRYFELFKECYQVKSSLQNLTIPFIIFQSGQDEFVAPSSINDFSSYPHCYLLKESGHFYYIKSEREQILSHFQDFLACYDSILHDR